MKLGIWPAIILQKMQLASEWVADMLAGDGCKARWGGVSVGEALKEARARAGGWARARVVGRTKGRRIERRMVRLG